MSKMGELWAEGQVDRLECELSDLGYENHILKETIKDLKKLLPDYDEAMRLFPSDLNIEYLKYIGCAFTQENQS